MSPKYLTEFTTQALPGCQFELVQSVVLSRRQSNRPQSPKPGPLDFCHQPSLCEPLKTPAPRLERDRRRDDAGGDGGGADAGKFAAQSSRLHRNATAADFFISVTYCGLPCLLRANCLPGLVASSHALASPNFVYARQRLEFSSACPG